MIACTRCGHDNQEGELVCAQCGTEIDDAGAKALIGETVLGVYRITDILGRGGMSVVYKGTHKLTEQRVALKILPPELAVHAALKTRFLEEAKALARLEHANIVRLYNFGEEAGRFVLAMEYVEGQTFERMVMKHGKVPWALSTRIAVEVLRALEYAHDKGIVHRDIKPSNVLVRSDGSAMVMDFGIAKMTESTRLTATGQTMGTVRYMSPEQVRGQSVNLRTDLYSLGIALFEGIAGDTPFQGDTHFDIMSKHLSEPPPSLRAIVPDVPEALERVIHHAMGKAREDRYQTAAEFRVALEKCLEGVPADRVTPAPSRTATPLPAPLPRAPTPAPPNRAPMTGLASSLEPAFAEIVPSRRRTALWLGLAAAVAAGAAVVIVLMTRGHAGQGQGTAGRNPAGKPIGGAAPDAAGAAPEWPEPRRIPGVTYAVDQRFEGAERVRVLAVHAVDATKLAQTYQHAQQRFGAFVAKQRAGAVIEIHPLNLAVVAPATICEPALYAPDPAPANCANLTFRYDPHSRTLFVAEGDTLESLDIPEGAAVHLCRTTKALDDLICGKTFLVPFDEALEAEMSPPGGPP